MPLTVIQIREQLTLNIDQINLRIQAAMTRSKQTESVQLVAVTKYTPLPVVQQLLELGDFALGENRPQQLVERKGQLPNAQWHLIGQLQSNKVRSVLPHVSMIHSVDSLKLLKRVVQFSRELECCPDLLLQVNIAEEQTKAGFRKEELIEVWDEICSLGTRQICGLMTMAPFTDDQHLIRATFQGLREVRDVLQPRSPDMHLEHLSMGMSNDFEIAIEEGATLIRIGSLLFKDCDQ